ncbi:MAG: sugar ABC transporter permease [Chloroflexi bacterium]|nr:MAG: sugar ABC transporter permease [Chloroflexota bacterium]
MTVQPGRPLLGLRRWSPQQRREMLWAYAFLGPAFFFLLVLILYPILFAFWISLHDWSLIPRDFPFIGFQNYIKAFGDNLTTKSLKNTLIYTIGAVPVGMLLSLALALVMNIDRLPLRTFFRAVYFVPVITSWVAVSFVWRWLFEPRWGLVNSMLEVLGVTGIKWLASPVWALPAIMIVAIWKGLGYNMVIFLAGLQGIPRELREAATIDGANRWQSFWAITFPLLNPTIVFITVTAMIGSLQVFTPAVIMTTVQGEAGGPINSTRVMVYHIYSMAFRNNQLGYGAALAFVLFALILLVTIVQLRLTQRDIGYE